MPEFHGRTISQVVRDIAREHEEGNVQFDPILAALRVHAMRQKGLIQPEQPDED